MHTMIDNIIVCILLEKTNHDVSALFVCQIFYLTT